jgi:Zn-dependent protease with chaperone function
MQTPNQQPSFLRVFVFPTFWILCIPAATIAFFWHGQSKMDDDLRMGILTMIQNDKQSTELQKKEAREFFSREPVSRLIERPELAAMFAPQTMNIYWQFRWLIRLAVISIAVSIVTFVGLGLGAWISSRSQSIQYLTLKLGWNILKLVGVFQTIVQGLMLFALSYWVTALWFNVFVPKLMIIVAILAAGAALVVVKAIFTRVNSNLEADGFALDESLAGSLWQHIRAMCSKLNTEPPNQLIAGIDSNFFVIENPVTANETLYRGRTLYVSLPLLKQLNGSEADAVLAHEMAHFQAGDTIYSKKIAPLVARFDRYLLALSEGGPTTPVFYFMNCFRALFELSLSKLSREREFRADQVAAQLASPRDLAAALLKIAAYSTYRAKVQDELFGHNAVLQEANICDRIERGFAEFASQFADSSGLVELHSAHPFDSHPAMSARLEALGVPLNKEQARSLLMSRSDGRWYFEIDRAADLERAQWDEFEENFRKLHEQSLAFRYLPSNEEERQLVVRDFPEVRFESSGGDVVIDFEKIQHATWEAPIYFRDFVQCMNSDNDLTVQYKVDGKSQKKTLKYGSFKQEAVPMLAALQQYYGRYLSAVAYQRYLEEQKPSEL